MKVNKELVKGSLDIIVLSVLREEDLYGYEIAKRIKDRSDELFTMGEGTLYPLLHKLAKLKYLDAYWQEVDGRRRKYYSVTRAGKKALDDKVSEWKTFSDAVNAIVLA